MYKKVLKIAMDVDLEFVFKDNLYQKVNTWTGNPTTIEKNIIDKNNGNKRVI